MTEREARLIELDPGCCDVICRRWLDWSGEAATLDGGGPSWDAIVPAAVSGDHDP